MKKIILFITMSLLLQGTTFAQATDLSFENWYTDTSGYNRLTNWNFYAGPSTYPGGVFGTWRSDTAAKGSHALKLSRWYNYTCDWAQQVAAISSRPWGISGYYKYEQNELALNNLDSALVEIVLTKWNSTTLHSDTVGLGSVLLLASANFSLFNCPAQYTGTDIPDTVTINLRPMPWSSWNVNTTGWGSFFTVDDLSFENRGTGITTLHTDGIHIYPNPVADKLHVNATNESSFAITDITGRILKQSKLRNGDNVLDVSLFAAGTYLLVISDDDHGSKSTKFIKE